MISQRENSDNPKGEFHPLPFKKDNGHFLKQVVQSKVGTLVEGGLGKRQRVDLKQILETKDRRAAGKTAPPHGLYLVKVLYYSETD